MTLIKSMFMLMSLFSPLYGPRCFPWPLPGLIELAIVVTPDGYWLGVWNPHGLYIF